MTSLSLDSIPTPFASDQKLNYKESINLFYSIELQYLWKTKKFLSP